MNATSIYHSCNDNLTLYVPRFRRLGIINARFVLVVKIKGHQL